MFNDSSHDISVLNSLIETTVDSVDGYRRSAEEATNSRFAAEFRERAGERQQVVTQLQSRVRELGGNPEDEGGILAAAHRAFLSLRDAVTGTNDEAVIAEVDRGESFLNSKWEAPLTDERLSPETRSTINQCYSSVRAGHDRFEALNRSATSTAGATTTTAY